MTFCIIMPEMNSTLKCLVTTLCWIMERCLISIRFYNHIVYTCYLQYTVHTEHSFVHNFANMGIAWFLLEAILVYTLIIINF
jgi:hypothetical protein